jgi:flagellar biosynthesis protein FlhF
VKIKSYYAQTIPEAMERARVELGDDAMIIASNRTAGDTQRLGTYEVVFGVTDQGSGAEKPALAPRPATPTPPQATAGLERLKERMEDLRKSVSNKREQISAAKATSSAKTTNAARIASVLVQTGFPRALADEIAATAQRRLRDKKQDMLAAIRAEISSRVQVSPRLGAVGQSRSTVALIGPPGVGKTTTIAKLAVKYGLAAGRPTRLISTDTFRMGGTDLLRKYADAMGIRLETPATADALERRLESEDRNELLLIDTPGFRPVDSETSGALASLLSKRADVDVHLVLPAYASLTDLNGMTIRLKSFLPSKLIFTGVDQCLSGASMLAYSIDAGLPVSFTGCGQEVPEDLEEASSSTLMSRLLPGLMDAAASAA